MFCLIRSHGDVQRCLIFHWVLFGRLFIWIAPATIPCCLELCMASTFVKMIRWFVVRVASFCALGKRTLNTIIFHSVWRWQNTTHCEHPTTNSIIVLHVAPMRYSFPCGSSICKQTLCLCNFNVGHFVRNLEMGEYLSALHIDKIVVGAIQRAATLSFCTLYCFMLHAYVSLCETGWIQWCPWENVAKTYVLMCLSGNFVSVSVLRA